MIQREGEEGKKFLEIAFEILIQQLEQVSDARIGKERPRGIGGNTRSRRRGEGRGKKGKCFVWSVLGEERRGGSQDERA